MIIRLTVKIARVTYKKIKFLLKYKDFNVKVYKNILYNYLGVYFITFEAYSFTLSFENMFSLSHKFFYLQFCIFFLFLKYSVIY